ncbi:hypothetical protein HDU97_005302 [Phlyctochytrium planicorne]|nr:hypothetical protein HDU97_005302 [Phlyctochytrium planicorne]
MHFSQLVAFAAMIAAVSVQGSPCPYADANPEAKTGGGRGHLHRRALNTDPSPITLASYTALPAKVKQAALMSRIMDTVGVTGHLNTPVELVTAILTTDNNWVMNDWAGLRIQWPPKNLPDDEIPIPFQKGIHAVGMCASAVWVPSASNLYTGVFASGADLVVRFSLAAPAYQDPTSGAVLNIIPGLGLKALRTGRKSGNLVSMFSLAGQSDTNFFANKWNTHVSAPPPSLFTLETAFRTSTRDHTNKIGLSDFATYDKNGIKTTTPKFPFKLTFTPTTNAPPKAADAATNSTAWRQQVASIPIGKTLWDITAWDRPDSTTPVKVGTLVVTSKPVTSKYCDDRLLFRHQRWDDDLKLRKTEWSKACIAAGLGFECRQLSHDDNWNAYNNTGALTAPINKGLPGSVSGLPPNFSDA